MPTVCQTSFSSKANDAILYEKEDLYDDLKENYGATLEYIAGGATQNSMRVAQWVLGGYLSNCILFCIFYRNYFHHSVSITRQKPTGVKKATAFFGCVGKDDTAATLSKCAEDAGVDVRYQVKITHGDAMIMMCSRHFRFYFNKHI